MAHAHDHSGHGHGPGHSHAPPDFGRAFLIGTTLNIGFVIVEAGFGFATNSMALLADAGHNLSDVLGLLVAWAAATLAKKSPSERYTYGWRRSSILAALFNALFLLVAIGAIAFEAIRRFSHPEPIEGGTVMLVAGIGVVINTATAMLFASGRKGDINIRGAYLHMAADAAVSAGVVISGLIILQTNLSWIDPLTSLVIAAVILFGTWGLLRESVALSMDRVPDNVDPAAVTTSLQQLPGVARVHDLHIWPMSTTEIALTCHLVMPSGSPGDGFLRSTADMLHDQFGIGHSTIQIETSLDEDCDLAPPSKV
jgi:cobalt-zinc-cadmium efflux system protein